jgi:hypothetical protein
MDTRLHCKCQDCGKDFRSHKDSDQCDRCRAAEERSIPNVDPTKPGNQGVFVYATHGRRGGRVLY